MWRFTGFVFRPFILQRTQVSYDPIRPELEGGEVDEVVLGEALSVYPERAEAGTVEAVGNTVPAEDRALVTDLLAQEVTFRARAPSSRRV